MATSADLLDLNGIGSRADGFTFQLLDRQFNVIGNLDADDESPPHVRNDTSRSIFRTCTGLTVRASTLAQIDTRTERVRPVMTLQNGAAFPLGVFMFGQDVRAPYSWGTSWTPELFDLTFMVDQPLDQTVGLTTGDSILALVNALVGQIGLPSVDLSGVNDGFASSTASYPAGSSRRLAINALLALLGCYPPFFDNFGTYTTKAGPGANPGIDHVYASNGRIIDGTTTVTNSAYRAPNRYQVISSSPSGAFVGIFDLPDNAPNSYASTGVRVTASTTMQGLPSVSIANLAAYIQALTDRNSYVQASFSSTADPRHDTFDLVDLLGNQYQEVAWEIECRSGGVMSHTLIGLYGAAFRDTVIDVAGGGSEGGGGPGADPGGGLASRFLLLENGGHLLLANGGAYLLEA